MSNEGDSYTPVKDTDSTMSAKLSFLTKDGRRFFFGEISQLTITIGNTKHSLNPIKGNIISMKHKGGKGCLRRRKEKRARISPKPGEKNLIQRIPDEKPGEKKELPPRPPLPPKPRPPLPPRPRPPLPPLLPPKNYTLAREPDDKEELPPLPPKDYLQRGQ